MTARRHLPGPTSDPGAGMPSLRRPTLALYWGSLFFAGVHPGAMQGLVDSLRRGHAAGSGLDGFWIRFFSPDAGLFFQTALGALPGLVFAVFALLHLGTAARRGAEIARRRRTATWVAAAVLVATSLAGQWIILGSRGSTAALGFLFLPFGVGIATVAGYGLGRRLAAPGGGGA